MRQVVMALCILMLLTGFVRAAGEGISVGTLERSLPPQTRDLIPEGSSAGSALETVRRVLTEAVGRLDLGRSAGKAAWMILLIVILCGSLRGVCGESASRAVTLAGAAAIGLCFLGDFQTMAGLGAATLEEYETFSAALFPTLAAASAASGAPSASTAIYGVSVGFFHLLIRLIRSLFLPVLYGDLALATVDAALEQNRLEGIRSAMEGGMKTGLRILLFAFSAFLAVSGVSGAAVDATALKAAKLSVSASVPVVGGMLSDATESVLAGAKILQNSVGVFGMLAVLAIGIVPFLRMGIQYLFLQISCALCGVAGEPKLAGLVRSLAGGMGYLLAMVSVCGILTFLSCVCFLRVSVL